MALAIGKLTRSTVDFIQIPGVRYRLKTTPIGMVVPRLSLKQKFDKWNYKDPAIYYKVDIGYKPSADRKQNLAKRLQYGLKLKQNLELEKAARDRTLIVDLKQVEKDWNESTTGPQQIQDAAEYYGVFEDLFEDAYFTPVIPLDIKYTYSLDEEYTSPVYRGNLMKSYEAINQPEISYEAKDDELFTLVMSTPDCHFTKERGEYLLWSIGNIPGNKIEAGEELCNYLRPFPLRGAGFCRFIFILYKQEKRLDFDKYKLKSPYNNLTARTFYTYDFYRENQDNITPAGLAFFQADWDPSLTSFFHNVLEMKEPSFEYDFNPKKQKPQYWFPQKKAFNFYMDDLKETKVLQQELLLEKLKEVHPFDGPPKRPKYPLAHYIDKHLPTWLKDDIRRRRMREGKWKFM